VDSGLAGVALDEFSGSPWPGAAAGCGKSGLPISAGFPVFGFFVTAGRSTAGAVHHLKNNQDS
jgi:hypothetical protein